jgi:hypothetical protein
MTHGTRTVHFGASITNEMDATNKLGDGLSYRSRKYNMIKG